tara:strand:+ start:278 stop:577 length:300 start_codon:yes stop_codon:yes gene_type:complete
MENGVSSQDEKLKEYLTFQIHRNIVNLYKQHLVLLQDIAVEHQEMMGKLRHHIDKEILEDVNYLNKNKLKYYRKKTLDVGNEAIRDFENSVENLKITLK